MGKAEEYRAELRALDSWDDYLFQGSRLPGPRANLELAYAVAREGKEQQFLRWAAIDAEEAPQNTAGEFLPFCGVLGLGYGWSVAVAAQPLIGKPYMARWVVSDDPDIRWIMRQNLKK